MNNNNEPTNNNEPINNNNEPKKSYSRSTA